MEKKSLQKSKGVKYEWKSPSSDLSRYFGPVDGKDWGGSEEGTGVTDLSKTYGRLPGM